MNLELFSLKGRNALVTGSRIGLGKAIAVALAEAGANVVVHGSKQEGLDQAAHEVAAHGGKVAHMTADVADPQACAALVEFTIRELDPSIFWSITRASSAAHPRPNIRSRIGPTC